MTVTSTCSELDHARSQFRRKLFDEGFLIPTGLDGLYGRGGAFEDLIDAIDTAVTSASVEMYGHGNVQRLRFPPIFPREIYEKTDYIASFPHLTGAISTFTGDNKEHQKLLAEREQGIPWDGHLSPAGTMLVSASCHPSYATLPPVLPAGGTRVDVNGYCFRHEPSVDPARMQAFRMREVLYAGEADNAAQHRLRWIPRALQLLEDLGLEAHDVPANDPFFGRVGKMLTQNQLDENLKTEMVVRIYGDLDDGTAVASSNYHKDHFGEKFSLTTADGDVAHSACSAFGLERIALAMLSKLGTDTDKWPASVRARLTGDA